MSKQHTPGPWRQSSEEITDVNQNAIAHVYDWNDYYPANAQLIAAAPDLVEALIDQAKETARIHRDSYDEHRYAEQHYASYLTDKARAALAKAGVNLENTDG